MIAYLHGDHLAALYAGIIAIVGNRGVTGITFEG